MAIGATTQVMVGGKYSTGPSDGQYHIKVTDAQISQSSKGTPQMVLELTITNDPEHAAKEGKKLTKMFQTLSPADPTAADAGEKQEQINGMLKRLLFDGFGLKWPDKSEALDPRDWQGKTAWVMMQKKTRQNGESRAEVVAIAQNKDGLPVPKGVPTGNGNGTATAAAGKTAGRRR